MATAALGLGPVAAHAQPADEAPAAPEPTKEELAAARQLFKEGLALEKRDEWGRALENFERVGRVKMTPQVRFHVALCHEHLGRFVDAINGFELAVQGAKLAGDKAMRVVENAPKRAAALRERIGFVHLTVSGTIRSSKILLDGKVVSEALVGTEIPVDPGTHVIEVETAGEIAFREEIEISKQQLVDLELPIDDPEPPPDVGPDPTGDVPPGQVTPPVDEGVGTWPAYLIGGVGLAAAAAGGIMWGLGSASIADIREGCEAKNDKLCDPQDRETMDLGTNYYTAGNILVPVGGGLVAAGVVLLIVLTATDGPDDAETADDAEEPEIAIVPTGTGVQLVGTF